MPETDEQLLEELRMPLNFISFPFSLSRPIYRVSSKPSVISLINGWAPLRVRKYFELLKFTLRTEQPVSYLFALQQKRCATSRNATPSEAHTGTIAL